MTPPPTLRSATVWATLTVVLEDGYPGDYIDLQQDVTRALDDTPLVHNERVVGHVVVTGMTGSTVSTVRVDE